MQPCNPLCAKKTTSGRMLGMCYILCTSSSVTYLGGFSTHGFFADGFLFPVKELGFWTNLGDWVRVLDAASSDMYFLL